ncbi:MAG: FG-GAP-like repeat-containing protein, partial [Planctomycetota bacterium]|nr:FG-GAP-like repeat-containing protein [Planctomycetota bacterium]
MTLIFRSHTAMLLTLMLGCVLWGAVGSTNAQKRTSFTRSRLDTSSKRISAIESDSSLASSELTFTEVSITAGLGMPGMETNAVAWGDYDNDGDPDLYFANNGVNRLFRNDGNDVFTDVTTLTGTGDPGNSRGVAWGDFDNDGNLDLYVANDQGQLDVLYRNDGDDGIAGQTKFSNITLAAGTTITDGAGGVTLLDFNRDGLLDIFLAGYGDDVLYRNISDFQFAPETMYSESQQSIHLGFGAVASDVDGDGWTDIFVSDQNGGPSRLYMNEQGSLIDRAAAIGLLIEGYGNGVIALDYDRDSRMDLYWGTWPGEDRNRYRNKLMRNLGNGAFTNVGAQSLVSDANGWAMGANAADVNNDGWIDFFLANGQSGNTSSSVLFLNNGDGTFSDGTSSLGLSGGDHRGVAFADYDGDGDMDLCLTGGTLETTRLFRNDLNSSDHWLDVELTGRESNHASIGARVSVTIGTDVLVQEISGGAGLGSQNSARLHFGLGQAQFVESVQIRWPNGQLQEQLDVSVDQVLEIKEPLTSADLNNDGVVDVEDLLILLTAWGDCPDCNADVDSDDRVTVFDLLFILSSYGDIVEEVQEVDIFPAPEAGWTNFTPSA